MKRIRRLLGTVFVVFHTVLETSNIVAAASEDCQSLYTWDDFVGELGGRNYTGIARTGQIFSCDVPVFDNDYLEGDPVGALKGSLIDDIDAKFSTGVLAYTFYDKKDQLVVYFGIATRSGGMAVPNDNYGVPVGGTGSWTNFQGFVSIQNESREYESPSITNYTVCSAFHVDILK